MVMAPRGKRWLAPALAAGGLVVGSVLGGAAQEATPTAAHAHPAHIHLGSCDQLDPNPTYPLSDVTSGDASADAPAIPVERSVTTVAATLEEIRSGGYAINIHQSAEDIGTYIACGSLSGPIADGSLVVGLGELHGSGHAGIAVLTGNGEQTEVTVYLAAGLFAAAGAATASAATGEHDMAAMDATVVDIVDLMYAPAIVEIPAGGTITWTNNDTAPHTVTAQDRALLQSGMLNPGESFSQTFNEPGSIDYFCEFHANMKGTIGVQ